MRIPEVRDEIDTMITRLKVIADTVSALSQQLLLLREELVRRSPKKRVPNTSTRMTPELAEMIAEYAAENPDASQAEIAEIHNVNPGRVSEVLRGKRT